MTDTTTVLPTVRSATWPEIALAILSAVMVTLHVATPADPAVKPNDPPVVVQPVVPPVVDPVKPVQPVAPKVVPTPAPANAVSIVDEHGNAVAGTVPAGTMVIASAAKGVVLTPVLAPSADAFVNQTSDNAFSAVLRGNTLLQIVVTGNGKPNVISIQSVIPPPPTPIDVTPVTPNVVDPPVVVPPKVVPKVAGVRVIILFDHNKAETAAQVNAMNSPKLIALLNSSTVKDSVGRPSWRRWQIGSDVSAEPAPWPDMMAACVSKLAEEPVALPAICIARDDQVTIYPITDETSVLSNFNGA